MLILSTFWKLSTMVDRSPCWPLMVIFKIDGFRELLKQTNIISIQDVVTYYLVVESGMISKIVIGFEKCRFQLRCKVFFAITCTTWF